jgi:DNA-binding transcriptional regulator YhcF (GntR family)
MDWQVDPEASKPPSRQLVERCLEGLAGGELRPGDRLPSVRGLAALALVNHNTVARAYRELEGLGVVRGEGGRGVFLTAQAPAVAEQWRRSTAWTRFEGALESALRAGYAIESLVQRVRAAARTSDGEQSA